MNFSSFFSEQARKPDGLFGRVVMSIVFDRGNAFLNNFVNELISIKIDDRIIEIGFGTGKLIDKMAQQIDTGLIEGVDFSKVMVSIARKRKKNLNWSSSPDTCWSPWKAQNELLQDQSLNGLPVIEISFAAIWDYEAHCMIERLCRFRA